MYSDAWKEGYEVGTKAAWGDHYETNPYEDETKEFDDWEEGFQQAGWDS